MLTHKLGLIQNRPDFYYVALSLVSLPRSDKLFAKADTMRRLADADGPVKVAQRSSDVSHRCPSVRQSEGLAKGNCALSIG